MLKVYPTSAGSTVANMVAFVLGRRVWQHSHTASTVPPPPHSPSVHGSTATPHRSFSPVTAAVWTSFCCCRCAYQVIVEAIGKGEEDEGNDEETPDQNGDSAYDQEVDSEDDGWHEEEEESDAEDRRTSSLSRRGKSRKNSAGEGVARRGSARSVQRSTKRQPSRRLRTKSPSAAVVYMRHRASGALFVWRTAGVKDTHGEELHEGEAYRLVASVKEPPDVAAREVGVTRCRLSLVTDVRR